MRSHWSGGRECVAGRSRRSYSPTLTLTGPTPPRGLEDECDVTIDMDRQAESVAVTGPSASVRLTLAKLEETRPARKPIIVCARK